MSNQLKPSSKKARILSIFLEGEELDRLIAESRGDHVLPQTVHSLERHGLAFQRRDKTVQGWGGSRVTVTAYRLRPESYAQACALLGMAPPSGLPGASLRVGAPYGPEAAFGPVVEN